MISAKGTRSDNKKKILNEKQKKRKLAEAKENSEEKELEHLLFGGITSLDHDDESLEDNDASQKSQEEEAYGNEDEFDAHGILLDRKGISDAIVERVEINKKKKIVNGDDEENGQIIKPAWEDPDETKKTSKLEPVDYEESLRQRKTYVTTMPTSWAKVNPSELTVEEELDEVDRAMSSEAVQLLGKGASSLTTLDVAELPPTHLSISRCPDANLVDQANTSLSVVKFHPTSNNLLFTASLDGRLKCYNVDGEHNPKVHGVRFADMPIVCASFLGTDGGSMVVSGNKPHYYIYDIKSGNIDKMTYNSLQLQRDDNRCKGIQQMITSPSGRFIVFSAQDGYLLVVDGFTRQLVQTLKMNGSCCSMAFSQCGLYLMSAGSDGQVYQWDMRNSFKSRCVNRITNEDGSTIRSLAISDQYLAIGADSGVVNLYPNPIDTKVESLQSGVPLKRFLNLRTSVSGMQFNHDGRILATWSGQDKKTGLKLMHTKSQTVFANWPTSKTPLGFVQSVSFSSTSDYMAFGNDKGKCLLYKLLHYYNQ